MLAGSWGLGRAHPVDAMAVERLRVGFAAGNDHGDDLGHAVVVEAAAAGRTRTRLLRFAFVTRFALLARLAFTLPTATLLPSTKP